VAVEGKIAEQVLRLTEALEESEDTQHVHANFDAPDEMLEKLETENT
jgi:transcriptional/translational regulatory protein YebC/TACO1